MTTTPQSTTTRYRVGVEWRTGDESQELQVMSPVDGSVLGSVHEYTHADIDEAFAAAAAAQRRWAARGVSERADLLHAWADLLVEHAAELGEVLMMEVAKARKDARDEVVRSGDYVHHTAEDAKRVIGESQFSDSFPGQVRNKLSVVHRVPLGTVLAIPPSTTRSTWPFRRSRPASSPGTRSC